MKKLDMPSFANTKLNEDKTKRDISEFAYAQGIPMFSSTGKVATRADRYNMKGGDFVFPNCNFRINFDQLDGIARMAWRATECRHFTMCSEPNSKFSQLGFSLQLNTKTANVLEKEPQERGLLSWLS
ncbi:hypothetical protein KEM48_012413 [Puccinia striiformis f. sp. tritici PST-130]|nr:hypothetical protein KEM48_012413 [Puccinia striiformis f. sp. tritici PST-130]